MTASDRLTRIAPFPPLLLLCLSFLLSSFLYPSTSHVSPAITLRHTFELLLPDFDSKCVCELFSLRQYVCVHMCVSLCANMEVLVYLRVSPAQSYVFVLRLLQLGLFSFSLNSFRQPVLTRQTCVLVASASGLFPLIYLFIVRRCP